MGLVFVILLLASLALRDRFVATVSAVCALAFASAVVVLHGADGEIFGYLTSWLCALPAALVVAAGVHFLCTPRTTAFAIALAGLLSVALLVVLVIAPVRPASADPVATSVAAHFLADPALRDRRQTITVVLHNPDVWPSAVGTLDALQRAGFRTRVQSDFVDVFDLQHDQPTPLSSRTVDLWATSEYQKQPSRDPAASTVGDLTSTVR